MLETKTSKAQAELIEFLQEKNKVNCNGDYKPKPFFKPNKSLLRRWINFMNPFYQPGK